MVQERIKAVFAQVFQVDPAQLHLTVSPSEIEGWDSFGHLALVEALQNEFRVEFELEDIAEMDNLEAIEDILRRRGAGPS
jgi:acyl carrier protein